jgi:2-polyprenyl-3-methyl-5-hydroxy-6-metoxy-1,4-benzoquinol methylase
MSKTEFQADHYDHLYPVGIEFQYWQIARNKTLLKLVRKYCNSNDRILEVGCGRGDVLTYFRKHGLDCWGVELADEVPVLEAVKDYIQIGVDANTLPEEFRHSVKIITLFDVIEHLPDPSVFLNELKQNFPNLTHFIITVPACQEIWSNYDEFNGHYRRYDLKMMREQGKAINAEVMNNRFFFKMLYLPARILLSIKKQRNTVLKGPKPGFARLVHRFIANVSVLIDSILPASFKGSSVLAVMKVRKG